MSVRGGDAERRSPCTCGGIISSRVSDNVWLSLFLFFFPIEMNFLKYFLDNMMASSHSAHSQTQTGL